MPSSKESKALPWGNGPQKPEVPARDVITETTVNSFSTLSSLRLSLPLSKADPPRVDLALLDDDQHNKALRRSAPIPEDDSDDESGADRRRHSSMFASRAKAQTQWTGIGNERPTSRQLPSRVLDGPEASSRKAYEQACSALNILPSTTINLLLSRQTFNLPHYGLSPAGGKALAAAVRVNISITELLIPGNGLGNVGIEHVANAVRKNGTIRKLDLSRNNGGINQRGGERAVAAVAQLLRDNATLTALNVSGNNMGDAGMKLIAEAAATAARSSLSEIDFGNCGGAALAAPAIANMLQNGHQLTRVGLSAQKIPSAAWAEMILPAAQKAVSLLALDISHNNVAPSTGTALCSMLSHSKSLKVLDICAVALPEEAFTVLADQVAKPTSSLEMLITDVRGGRAVTKQLKALKKQMTKDNNGVKAQLPGPRVSMRAGTHEEMDCEDIDFTIGPFVDGPGPVTGGIEITDEIILEEQVTSLRHVPDTGERSMAWEGPVWARSVAHEMDELTRAAAGSRPATAEAFAELPGWKKTRASQLELKLKMALSSLKQDPLDVRALQQKALASALLHDYHQAAEQYLQSMAQSQEDVTMVECFQQAMDALRIRRTRALIDAQFLTLRILGRRTRKPEEDPDDPPPPPPPPLGEPYSGPRRHARFSPKGADEPPPDPLRLLCAGFEDAMRRCWSLLDKRGDAAWERYRLREYLRDAQNDLRATYDWYRSQPRIGLPQAPTEPEACEGAFHCRLSWMDSEAKTAGSWKLQFDMCRVCSQAGVLHSDGIRRFLADAKLHSKDCGSAEMDRLAADCLAPVATMGPENDPEYRKPAEEDNTERRREAPADWAEKADEYKAKVVHHATKGSLGFYEWVELIVRIAADRGPKELLSWTFDKIVKDCAPEGCAKYIIPPGLPGSAVAAARPGSRATGAASSLPPSRQGTAASGSRADPPGAFQFVAKPPLPDARDPIQRMLDGPGRDAFLGVHRLRLVRVYRYFHGTHGGKVAVDYLSTNEPEADSITLNFNNILMQFERLARHSKPRLIRHRAELADLFTPNLTVAKLRQHCIKILRNEEILAQDNPINVKAEMTFDQWLELMARFAPPPGAKSAAPAAAASKPGSKAKPAAAPAAAVPSAPAASVRFTGVYKSLDAYLEETIYPIAQRVWPGRW